MTDAVSGRGSRRTAARRSLAFTAAVLLAAAPAARAAETQWWTLDSASDHAKSEAHGAVVRPDGAIELGPRASVSTSDSLGVVWAVVPMRDGSVALACDRGRIARWTESGGVREWVKLPVGQVLALAADGDGLVAGTGPEGRVYHVGARGDTALIAATGERYVWGLAPAAGGAWYAATGTRGRLLEVSRGKVRVVIDSDESNLVSIVSDGHGGVYAGGDSHGRVLHARADGTVQTVYDAAEDEVRALALGPDGALYAAALTASAVSDDSDKDDDPAPARAAVAGGRATVYRIVPDSATVALWIAPQPFVFALAATREAVFAATGNRAAVYRLDAVSGATLWLAAPQGQVTALATDARGTVFAATSNPVALWRLGPARAERGELLSPVLDARRLARFGRVVWHGEAAGVTVGIETRSGNTDPPDTTWSRWSRGASEDHGARVSSPPARYLQWRLTLAGGAPRIESVETSWREQNLPPRIDDLVVAPQGQSFREGELTPRMEPITQTLPGGQKVEYSVAPTGAPKELRDLPAWARGLRTVQWRGSDPNGDALTYRIEVRHEGEERWTEVKRDLDTPTYTWDTNALPDGRYRLRVTASDAAANAVGEEQSGNAESAPFAIDNTPPTVPALEARGGPRGAIELSGRAEDVTSTLTRIEVSVDGGDWRSLTPDGGFADRRTLDFHATLPAVTAGEHAIGVRAVDASGNTTLRATRVTLAAGR